MNRLRGPIQRLLSFLMLRCLDMDNELNSHPTLSHSLSNCMNGIESRTKSLKR